MKKILLTLLAFFLLVTVFPAFASAADISLGNFISQYTNKKEVPSSYEYIQLKFKNLIPGTSSYRALQKLVYLNKFPNIEVQLPLSMALSEKAAAHLLKAFEGITIDYHEDTLLTQARVVDMLNEVMGYGLTTQTIVVDVAEPEFAVAEHKEFRILEDVYNRIINDHVNSPNIDETKLIQGAIKGMARATEDQYTSYFPPVDAKNFNDSMMGEFEGIGAYVDLPEPGRFMINAPIPGSPAEAAGLLAGDQVLRVDGKKITDDIDVNTIISWIKGPSGSTVTLSIRRATREFDVVVRRERIRVENITTEIAENSTEIIDINMFSDDVYATFVQKLGTIDIEHTKRIIIDLTYNPGGNLDQVKKILYHFVPDGQPLIYVRGTNSEEVLYSKGVPKEQWLGDKEIVVMINSLSASAAEIMAGDIREYVTKSVIIGEKSYGKGSVQNVIEYYDTSLLKITTAKWYTGKEQFSIDQTGIEPDILVSDDPETENNEILDAAKAYKF